MSKTIQALAGLLVLCLATGLAAREKPARVILVSIDGLRADVVTPELTPRLAALAASGTSTLEAQSLTPTFTIPNHVSMLTGLTPATHKLMMPDDPGDAIVSGTVLELAHAAGLRAAIYISKDKLRLLAKPGAQDRYFVSSTGSSRLAVDALLEDLSAPAARPDFSFIHIIEPDATGHRYGWMSGPYKAAVKQADGQLGRILDKLVDLDLATSTFIVVTADHGGLGAQHTDDVPEVKNIPWVAAGPGVPHGAKISRLVAVNDTAPTILAALGLEAPQSMEGSPVEDVFSKDGISFVRGDVDADGGVTLSDVNALLVHLFQGHEAACSAAGDADANRRLSITDAVYLLGHLFLGRAQPPPPFPECGLAGDAPLAPCAVATCP